MKNKTILIIDDDDLVRKTLRDLLEFKDYSVDVAENGSLGIEKAKSNLYDVVLLDLNLPDMHGIEVLKEIQSAKLKTSVIMMTGDVSPATEENAKRLGAVNYLSKPIVPRTLFTAIQKAR